MKNIETKKVLYYEKVNLICDKDECGLDFSELDRLQFFAEHPEFADPIFLLLPKKKRKHKI